MTLAPPVEKWFIEVEGDIDLMAASDIARTTVEVHYPLFGQEKFTAIPLSPRRASRSSVRRSSSTAARAASPTA